MDRIRFGLVVAPCVLVLAGTGYGKGFMKAFIYVPRKVEGT